jgi:acyl-CoA reductase-like NAD-dependent aldehyde dehydrogenase
LFNSGQVCVAIKRVYVHETVYDRFRDAIVEFLRRVNVGSGSDEGVFLGPLQNIMQYEKVKALLSDTESGGGTVMQPGQTVPSKGYFIRPTLVDNPPDSARIVVDEPFGPIFPMIKWSDEEDVIRRANDTRMGLGASVWSKDLDRASKIARRLEAGSVWINTHQEGNPYAPFGGFKESGIGSEWGREGLKSYCNMQSLFLKKPEQNGM